MTEQRDWELRYLTVELPEDITRVKEYGDFELAQRMIGNRLLQDLPNALHQRLLLEREIIRRLPEQYPYGWAEAMELLEETFLDFREAELQEYVENGGVEWIYIQGAICLKDNFIANLVKTREALAPRLKKPQMLEQKRNNFALLNQTIQKMKRQGRAVCHFHICSTVTIREAAQRPGEKIQVQIPVPIAYSPVRNFRLLGHMPGAAILAPAQYPQRTICFETEYRHGQQFQVEYELETEMRYWSPGMAGAEMADLEPEMAGAEMAELEPEEVGADRYLKEELPHICFSPYLKSLTEEVVAKEPDVLKRARAIYDFISTQVMYSFVRSYFTISQHAAFAASNLKGDCGIQALLFITMCRIAGIPARWQSGLYATPLEIGCHDWAQFYIEPYGWLYADCSFGGAAYRAGEMERWDFYFGNLDPYRIPTVSHYQTDFYIPKKYLRSDPYDNQMGEAEYGSEGLLAGRDFELLHEVVEVELPYEIS